MRTVKHFVFTIIMAALFFASAAAQDRVRLSAVYNRTDFPLVRTGGYEATENVNGFTAEADVKIFNAGGARISVAYNGKRMLNQEVYPNYFDGKMIVDLYRDVWTHSGGAQLGYTVKNAIEPFGALFYGTRKIHEDAPRQTVRTFRVGVNIPFTKESPFFVKGYVDFEKPFGRLPAGFINPNTRTLGIGAGFRFGGGHEYKSIPPETTPAKPVAR